MKLEQNKGRFSSNNSNTVQICNIHISKYLQRPRAPVFRRGVSPHPEAGRHLPRPARRGRRHRQRGGEQEPLLEPRHIQGGYSIYSIYAGCLRVCLQYIYQVVNPESPLTRSFEIVDTWFASAYYVFRTGTGSYLLHI